MSIIQQFQNISGKTPISRRRALVGLSLFALTACSRSTPPPKSADGNVAYYTCTMHPFVRSQESGGTCPVCGMNLVPVSNAAVDSAVTRAVYIEPKRLQEIGAKSEVITIGTRPGTFRVPVAAVLPTGNKSIVFIDQGNGLIEPREIQLSAVAGDDYVVASGLKEGARVFVTAIFLIDAESRIQGVLKTWGEAP